MRKVTTTAKINTALTNRMLEITKAEVYYKTSTKTEIIDADKIRENLDFFCKSGIFTDALGWHFEGNTETNGYIAECGRMNPDTEIIISVYLRVCEDVNVEDIERTLLFVKE